MDNVTDEQLTQFVIYWGWVFPGLIIVTFLGLYAMAQYRRNKEIEQNKKELFNLKHRSNGVKEKVHD